MDWSDLAEGSSAPVWFGERPVVYNTFHCSFRTVSTNSILCQPLAWTICYTMNAALSIAETMKIFCGFELCCLQAESLVSVEQ